MNRLHLALALVAFTPGCLAPRDLGGKLDDGSVMTESDEGSPTPDSESPPSTDTDADGPASEGDIPSTDGADGIPPGATTEGEGDDSWPPEDGFDPVPDVGDRTLDDELLFIVDTPDGTIHLFGLTQRLGDTMQIWLQAGTFAGSSWTGAGAEVQSNALVVDNAFTVPFEDLVLPAGTHPFGDTDRVVDLIVRGRLYEDELLCGTVDFDFAMADDIADASFVARPRDEVGADPNPPLTCE